MRVDPALAAFASDPSGMARAQGRVLSARTAWAARPEVRAVLADCAKWGRDGRFEDCTHLRQLISGGGAREFAEGWLAAMIAAWRKTPLAQVPFRHSYSGGTGAVHLHSADRVTLALMVVEPQAASHPRTIAFTDCERHEIVLAGRGEAVCYDRVANGPPQRDARILAPGARLSRDKERSRAIVSLDTPLVLLRIARDPEVAEPLREVEIATGRVVHRASTSPADGRAELAAALLGAMGRSDAAPTLADYACGQAGEGARWQALRNALALDTAEGFEALCRVAERPEDPIADDAADLRDRLCTSYPQLANMREEQCLVS